MKKYTLYQASKFTSISRYKLEQAIKRGHLTAEEGGRHVKFYISEARLHEFLKEFADLYAKEEAVSHANFSNANTQAFVLKDVHDQIIRDKERVISVLEQQNNRWLPLLDAHQKLSTLTEKQSRNIHELKQLALSALDLVAHSYTDQKETMREQLAQF